MSRSNQLMRKNALQYEIAVSQTVNRAIAPKIKPLDKPKRDILQRTSQFLDSIQSKRRQRLISQPPWQKPHIPYKLPGIDAEWLNYAWLLRKIRRQIYIEFKRRLRERLPLTDHTGRVFTTNWRVPINAIESGPLPKEVELPQHAKTESQNAEDEHGTQNQMNGSTKKYGFSPVIQPSNDYISPYLEEENFVLTEMQHDDCIVQDGFSSVNEFSNETSLESGENFTPADGHAIGQKLKRLDIIRLQRLALTDALVQMFTQPRPPRLPVSAVNTAGYLRLYDVVALNPNDYSLPRFPNSDTKHLPRYSRDFSELSSKPYTLEWMTISTMLLPTEGHDHLDLLMTYNGEKIQRVLTKKVFEELTRKGYGVEDLDRWINSAAASTAARAMNYMSGATVWPPFLLNLLLSRHLQRKDMHMVMNIIKKNYRYLNTRSQMIVFIRMSRHISRVIPQWMPHLCTIFVEQASIKLRTSFIYNKILKLISFHNNAHRLTASKFLLAAQRIIIKDMEGYNIFLNRDGYLSIINVLQTEAPTMANKMLELMSYKGYALGRLGRLVKAMLPLQQPDKEIIQFFPRGKHAEEIFDIYQASNIYEASAKFDSLAEKNTVAWTVFLTKLDRLIRLDSSQAISIWNDLRQAGVQPNDYTVCLLLRAMDNASAAVQILVDMENMGLPFSNRVLSHFVQCCHRDKQNVLAMSVARLFVKRVRPNDMRLGEDLHRINNRRLAAIRFPL